MAKRFTTKHRNKDVLMSDTDRIVLPSPLARAASVESRKWIRYPCDLAAFCWPIMHPAINELLPARVVDMSSAGLGMHLSRSLPVGTFLVVQIRDAAGESSYMMLTRIVRIVPTTTQTGDWTAGCCVVGKVVQTTAGGSAECGPELTASDRRGAASPRDPDALVAFVREQFKLLCAERDTMLAEKKVLELVNGERQEQLDRQAERLANRQGELEEREELAVRHLEQAIPERHVDYSKEDVPTQVCVSNQALLRQLFDQDVCLQQLTIERDSATARVQELEEQAKASALLRKEADALGSQLARDRRQLEERERDLHLFETELRETVEIAERESRRHRAEITEERLYLARMRESLRLQKQGVCSSSRTLQPTISIEMNGSGKAT